MNQTSNHSREYYDALLDEAQGDIDKLEEKIRMTRADLEDAQALNETLVAALTLVANDLDALKAHCKATGSPQAAMLAELSWINVRKAIEKAGVK